MPLYIIGIASYYKGKVVNLENLCKTKMVPWVSYEFGIPYILYFFNDKLSLSLTNSFKTRQPHTIYSSLFART